MGSVSDLVEQPLGIEQLGERFRALVEDPRFANVQGKVELDAWGRIIVSPASNLHALLQGRLIARLAVGGGEVLAEASVATAAGVLVADVAWMSPESADALGTQTPFPRAPDLCVEIASPSNSKAALEGKVAAYLKSGAREVWVVHPQSRQITAFGPEGALDRPSITIEMLGLFDSA